MDEQKIRAIVQDEIRRNSGASRFGVQNIPFHNHNGVNSVILPPYALSGVTALPGGAGGVSGYNDSIGNVLFNPILSNNAAYSFPTPLLKSEGLNGFGGGNAPMGTLVLFEAPTILDGYYLFANFSDQEGGDWHGVQLTESI